MNATTCPACRQTVEGISSPLAVCPYCGASLAPPPQTIDPLRGIDLLQVSRRQRALLWYILVTIALYALCFTPSVLPYPLGDVLLVLLILGWKVVVIIGVLRLHTALGTHIIWRIIGVFVLLVPLANILALLRVNARATRALRNAGLKVGLMGVRSKDVLQRFSVHLCRSCGYNLTGNVSGVCPECGTAIPS